MNATAACFGMACLKRGRCAHYAEVELPEKPPAVMTCETPDHRYPAFELIPVRGFVAPVAVAESEGGACD